MAQNENNHVGIKATPAWIAEGGRYGIYTDDKPNEKFCSYDSVQRTKILKQMKKVLASVGTFG